MTKRKREDKGIHMARVTSKRKKERKNEGRDFVKFFSLLVVVVFDAVVTAAAAAVLVFVKQPTHCILSISLGIVRERLKDLSVTY